MPYVFIDLAGGDPIHSSRMCDEISRSFALTRMHPSDFSLAEIAFFRIPYDQTNPLALTLKIYDLVSSQHPEPTPAAGLYLGEDLTKFQVREQSAKGPLLYWPEQAAAPVKSQNIAHVALDFNNAKSWPIATQAIVGLPMEDAAPLYKEVLARSELLDLNQASFITQLESLGYIHLLDQHILHRTLRELEARPELRLGVNAARPSLLNEEWFALLEDPRWSGVRARLYVEITETTAITNMTQVFEANLARVCDSGANLVLDDLGKGATTLSDVRNWPLDFVKLDRALVSWLAQADLPFNLIENIQSLGNILGWQLIAEGASDAASLAFLTAAGVPYAQGFAIEHPKLTNF